MGVHSRNKYKLYKCEDCVTTAKQQQQQQQSKAIATGEDSDKENTSDRFNRNINRKKDQLEEEEEDEQEGELAGIDLSSLGIQYSVVVGSLEEAQGIYTLLFRELTQVYNYQYKDNVHKVGRSLGSLKVNTIPFYSRNR